MQHVAPVIAERVNRFFGYPAVGRVVFRQGIVKVAKTKARIAPPSLKPLPSDIADSLREIADPELRAVLESLARGLSPGEGHGAPPAMMTIPVVRSEEHTSELQSLMRISYDVFRLKTTNTQHEKTI